MLVTTYFLGTMFIKPDNLRGSLVRVQITLCCDRLTVLYLQTIIAIVKPGIYTVHVLETLKTTEELKRVESAGVNRELTREESS